MVEYQSSSPLRSRWRALGASVRGHSHAQTGALNEDAIAWWPDSGEGPPVGLSVSDGHGSARSFRSHIGAALAVAAANKSVAKIVASAAESNIIVESPEAINTELAFAVLTAWTNDVYADLRTRPFTDEDLEHFGAPASEQNSLLAYGATILTAAVTRSVVAYAQLGDGDILCVSETGNVSRPLPKDARLVGNETTSLCMPNADREFRIRIQPLSAEEPALIFLSTDGYGNSYRSDEDFAKVAADIFETIKAKGWQYVAGRLEPWLNEVSRRGSGDDVTAGILHRIGEA